MRVRQKGVVLLVLAAVLALGLMAAPTEPVRADWPPVTVDLSVQQDANVFTAVINVRNGGETDTQTLNVRGKVPKGARYIDSWVGSGRGFNPGVFDGNDVGWINTSGVKAGATQGPFVYMFDVSEISPASRPRVSAWTGWAGTVPGSAVSRPVSIQNNSPVLDVDVGTPPPTGWLWTVAEIAAGVDEVVERANAHGNFWVFYTVEGSAELTTGEAKKVVSGGEAVFVPARLDHGHRYLPASRILVFDVHPADDPPSASPPG